tara:strand:- start:188 stop:472 length:285 start_codon:yes stop_codon:yes gene_type:complete
MFERNNFDLINQNPLMKNVYYEYEKPDNNYPSALPPRIRTHQLVRVPIMYDEPQNSQPKFRWLTSNFYQGEPEPRMKEWDERYRSTLNRMQGMY